eukprot:7206161-Pyramimonas_sp.AAC.1
MRDESRCSSTAQPSSNDNGWKNESVWARRDRRTYRKGEMILNEGDVTSNGMDRHYENCQWMPPTPIVSTCSARPSSPPPWPFESRRRR